MAKNLFDEKYRCKCGQLTGFNHIYDLCEICNTKVDSIETSENCLAHFVLKYVAKNSLIRLWKECDDKHGYYSLTSIPIMEWEILRIEELRSLTMVKITDIHCDEYPESINIIVDTKYSTRDVNRMILDFREKNKKERMSIKESE